MNKRPIKNIELAQSGHANGISTQLAAKGPYGSLTEAEKLQIIENAADAYAKFLEALGCDWESDPNSADTPRRVAKEAPVTANTSAGTLSSKERQEATI